MEKATQLVQGTPRLAASHRTCTSDRALVSQVQDTFDERRQARRQHQKQRQYGPFSHGKSVDSRNSQIHMSAEQFFIDACVGGLLVVRWTETHEMPRFTALDLLAVRPPGGRDDVPRMLATRAACNVV